MDQIGGNGSDNRDAWDITQITHPLATIWLGREHRKGASYFYGGTRLIDPSTSDSAARTALVRLMNNESGTKNSLINWAIHNGALNEFGSELPNGFLQSRIGGARCLVQPRNWEIASSLADPSNGRNQEVTRAVMQCIGETLNTNEFQIKLTPDFGRYSGLADLLYVYTQNVLGICCEEGGCGGKSSYSVTGILAGMRKVTESLDADAQMTCIGSAGALGSGVLNHFLAGGAQTIGVCDLVYDLPDGPPVPKKCKHLKSHAGNFTAECLVRGGILVATTVGDELESSPWELIPEGSVLFLAHNLALPERKRGIDLARALMQKGVLVIPGQVLTLGGALTARLEWYWRQMPSKTNFDKQLAHRVVDRLITQLVGTILSDADAKAITPHEAMLQLVFEDGK
jgi:hypothetical protein